jgi:hypothetical protein
MTRRAILLGLDGLDVRRIDQSAAAGELPWLAAARAAGRLVPLAMPFPTADAGWTSALTGLNPGWHGRFGDGIGAAVPVAGSLPDHLAARGDRATCRAFPVSAPTNPEAEAPAPEVHLRRLGELAAAVDEAWSAAEAGWRSGDAALAVVRLPEMEEALALASDYLFFGHPAFDLDLSRAVTELVRRVVSRADEALRAIAQASRPDDWVVALSTWGCDVRRTEIDLRAWLAGEGFLFADSEAIDWAHTRALPAGGFVRLAKRGREPGGVVEDGKESADLARTIEDGLSALIDPAHGIPVVRRVHRARDLYTGDRFADAPELFVEAFPSVSVTSNGAGDPVRQVASISSRPRGRLIGEDAGLFYSSRGVASGRAPTPLDVHATLAAWLGAPRARFTEGRNLLP